MASVRLTNELRSQILSNAMEGRFVTSHLQCKLARDTYKLLCKCFKQQRTEFAKLRNLNFPIGRGNYVQIAYPRVKGENARGFTLYAIDIIDKSLKDENDDTRMKEEVFAFAEEMDCNRESNWHFISFAFPARVDISQFTEAQQKQFEKLWERREGIEQIHRDRRELEGQINAVLHSVNTLLQLLEVWPEADEFLPVIPGASRAITVRIDALNKLMERSK